MADDLKQMLKKVSADKKTYHFAYGLGKRTDGNGQGELIVRKNKPKKEEVEEACECDDILVGRCWSSPDGETVYFQATGKKLSQMLVAKMALTAKRLTGRQYDFQVPSPAEEARGHTLAEGDEEGGTPPGAPPEPPARAADPRSAGKAKAGPDEAARRWEARWGKIRPALDQVLRTKPANLAQLRQTATEALKEAKVGGHARALELLERLQQLMKEAVAAALARQQGAPSPEALADWQAAREQAVVDIRKAAAAIAATKDPYAAAAIIELQSIIKNLTPRPQTRQAVAELERYLKTDEVITHAEDLPRLVATLRLREPLLNALKQLQA